jgi:hypothetical protein
MIRLYLFLNAAIYVLFGIASMINPDRMQRAVGYFTVDNSGSSEFLVIYAGLELGLAAFYLLAANRSELERPAILFSLCLYAGIVTFRLPSLMIYDPVRRVTLILAAGEVVLLLGAAWLARRRPATPATEEA